MLKIRRPLGRLIFNMGIAIPGKTVFLIETAPCKHNVKTVFSKYMNSHYKEKGLWDRQSLTIEILILEVEVFILRQAVGVMADGVQKG